MDADSQGGELRFIVDHNVGKLAGWLRMLGYDSVFFNGPDDTDMVRQAATEGRIILTRDTGVIKRRIITSGRLKAVLLKSENPQDQMKHLLSVFDLRSEARPFTLCLECNRPLVSRTPEEVADRVPPYVYRTQTQYMECPGCHRIYWRGTHWKAMMKKVEKLADMKEN